MEIFYIHNCDLQRVVLQARDCHQGRERITFSVLISFKDKEALAKMRAKPRAQYITSQNHHNLQSFVVTDRLSKTFQYNSRS